MATPSRNFATKFLEDSVQRPRIAERRGEYERKKWGQKMIEPKMTSSVNAKFDNTRTLGECNLD